MDKLDEFNFLLYAAKHYDNPQCYDTIEFYDDLKRIKYIKRLFNKYSCKKPLKDRLVLNHILILNNVFGAEACSRILFFKIEPKYHSFLKTFLSYLQILPKQLPDVKLDEIPVDHRIMQTLKEIK
jgi:hypothetical protein